MKKKILIFGGTGAIGFSIAKNLKSQGYNPIIIARNEDVARDTSYAMEPALRRHVIVALVGAREAPGRSSPESR